MSAVPAPTARRVRSAASNNLTSVKASAGCIHAIQVGSPSTGLKYLKIYDKASAPVVASDTPILTITVAASSSTPVNLGPTGLACSSGIAFAIVAGEADTDSTNVAAGDVHATIIYT